MNRMFEEAKGKLVRIEFYDFEEKSVFSEGILDYEEDEDNIIIETTGEKNPNNIFRIPLISVVGMMLIEEKKKRR